MKCRKILIQIMLWVIVVNDKIIIKRKKKINQSRQQRFVSHCEDWLAYWRANPQRYITEYLGLKLYDFQKFLIYLMNFFSNFIFVASNWCSPIEI